jgi:hypothetical protein
MKAGAITLGRAVLIFLGWCLLMIGYLLVYGAFEQQAVPVILPLREFSTQLWDRGYFHAKGSYRNESAIDAGDDIITGTTDITCTRSTLTCTVAVATVSDGFLNIDTDRYTDVNWDEQQITFSDDSATCATSSFVIDRASQSMNLLIRKKAAIPDYAKNLPLQVCKNLRDKAITLADGLQVYQHKIDNYERANGFKFHILLAALNVGYFALVGWLWRRRQRWPAVADV